MADIDYWKDVKPGDTIYLMVPEGTEDGSLYAVYRPQTATLIQAREKQVAYGNSTVWVIKFKYSDVRDKRKPLTVEIPADRLTRATLCSLHKTGSRKMIYGELLFSYDATDLARTYNNMVYEKTKSIRRLIDSEYDVLEQMNKTYISSEIFNTL